MSSQHEVQELRALGQSKSADGHEDVSPQELDDREQLARLGKKSVLKVRSDCAVFLVII